MRNFLNWLEDRTGVQRLLRSALDENVPGGARWRYVWGSTLTFALFVQFVTGLMLWTAYSPSAQTAWESVYFIEYEMLGGWLLRGIHHYTAQIMTFLLALHLMQVIIDGAYKAPREFNFWSGLLLLFLVLGLSLTGYLLPWDQKGYWATKVATSIAAVTPFIGHEMQQIIIGGSDYGHHTLTRFFALHAGILPGLIVGLIAVHIFLFRKHGLTAKKPLQKPDSKFWPDQVFRDAIACLAVMSAVLFLVFYHHGAGLGPPADPSEQYSAARPEWYFMFLFEVLKYFPASRHLLGLNLEVWGAMILPGFFLLLVALMPIIGRWRYGHRFNLGVLCAVGLGFVCLTWLAFSKDAANPRFTEARLAAEREANRVVQLAKLQGIPPEGAIQLLRNDPLIQGPKLFAANCSSCHRFDGHDGLGNPVEDPPEAPDLKGFASRDWIRGLLDPDQILEPHYFGGTRFADRSQMVRFVERDVAEFNETQMAMLEKVILAVSAEANLPKQEALDQNDASLIEEGKELAGDWDMRCLECHRFHTSDENADAPELTGYGSRQWMIDFISNPAQDRFYGSRNDGMPAFGEEGILTEQEIGLIVDWLREDWVRPDLNNPSLSAD